jgi:hypothetical protein
MLILYQHFGKPFKIYMYQHNNNENVIWYIRSYFFHQSISNLFLFFSFSFQSIRLFFNFVAHYNNIILAIKLVCVLSGCFQSFQCVQKRCFIFCNFLFWFFSWPTFSQKCLARTLKVPTMIPVQYGFQYAHQLAVIYTHTLITYPK